MRGCRGNRARIDRAVDGRLSLEERFLLEEHIDVCNRCRERYERAGAVQELLQRRPEPPVDRLDLEAAVSSVRAALEARGPAVPPPARRIPVRRLAVAAILVVAAVVAWRWIAEAEKPDPTAADTPDHVAIAVDPDSARLARVREEVRGHLEAAFVDYDGSGDPGPHVERFDEACRALHRAEWPVLRIVEDLVREDDLHLGGCAARYVGRRGDRTTAVLLGLALADAAAKDDIVWALGDLGEPAIGPLETALRQWEVADLATRQLGRIGGPRVTEVLEAEAARRLDTILLGDDRFRLEVLLFPALAGSSPEALESFLRLARAHPDHERWLLEQLPDVPEADLAFDRLVRTSGRRYTVELLCAAAVRLRTPSALAWVEQRAEDFTDRHVALDCLARWPGPGPLAALLRLEERGTVGDEELLATLDRVIDRNPDRLTRFVTARIRAGADLEPLTALLLAVRNPGTGAALVKLSLCDHLSPASRAWAALAVGEVGTAVDAEFLLVRLDEIDRAEVRLLAACLLTIHFHLGADGASRALDELAAGRSDRLFSILAEVNSSGTSAVGLHRVARVLDRSLSNGIARNRRPSS